MTSFLHSVSASELTLRCHTFGVGGKNEPFRLQNAVGFQPIRVVLSNSLNTIQSSATFGVSLRRTVEHGPGLLGFFGLKKRFDGVI